MEPANKASHYLTLVLSNIQSSSNQALKLSENNPSSPEKFDAMVTSLPVLHSQTINLRNQISPTWPQHIFAPRTPTFTLDPLLFVEYFWIQLNTTREIFCIRNHRHANILQQSFYKMQRTIEPKKF